MPTLTGSKTARTATLCVLYAAQGMPWGFVTIALLSYLAGQGAGLAETAKISSLATLPWTFKVFWGPILDSFTVRSMGRRRPWILFAQLAMSATLLAMILVGDLTEEFETLAWMVFLHNCFVSLQDVASDALAVDVLLDNERSSVNGMMWASSYVGTAIGGAGMGTVIANFGLRPAFCLQAGVLFLILLIPLLIRERAGERLFPWSSGEAQLTPEESAAKKPSAIPSGAPLYKAAWIIVFNAVLRFLMTLFELVRAFIERSSFLGLFFAYALSIMVGMRVAVMPVFYTQEIGWTDEHYSQIEGGIGSIAGVIGALVGGFLADRLGVKPIVTIAVLGVSAFCVAMGLSEELRASERFPIVFLLGTTFLISMMTVASFSLFMRLCTAAVAGTQYTLYMSMANLARVSGAGLVAVLEEAGYRTIFLVMAGAILVPLLFLYPIREPERAAEA